MFTRGFYRTFCISFHESLWYSRDHTLFIWHYIHLNKTKCMRQKKIAGIYDKVNYESVKRKWWILVKLLILSLCTGLDWDIIFFFFFHNSNYEDVFGICAETLLITQGCYSNCGAALALSQHLFCVSSHPTRYRHKGLEGGTADLSWPKGYSISLWHHAEHGCRVGRVDRLQGLGVHWSIGGEQLFFIYIMKHMTNGQATAWNIFQHCLSSEGKQKGRISQSSPWFHFISVLQQAIWISWIS